MNVVSYLTFFDGAYVPITKATPLCSASLFNLKPHPPKVGVTLTSSGSSTSVGQVSHLLTGKIFLYSHVSMKCLRNDKTVMHLAALNNRAEVILLLLRAKGGEDLVNMNDQVRTSCQGVSV